MRDYEWKKIIDKFNKSNVSKADFCKDNKLNKESFRRWYRHFNGIEPYPKKSVKNVNEKDKIVTKFKEVNIEPSNEITLEANSSIKITIGEAVIELNSNFNKSLLKDVITVLKESC